MKIKIDINIKVNRIIKHLVISDLLFLGSWSMISPIFSIFIIEKVEGASVVIVGMVAALYWLVKSLLQMPVANYLDKTDGEKDDFYALVIALALAALASFSFALTKSLWQLFFTQFLYAVAMGLYIPSWTAIFSRHLDEKKISFDWSLDSTVVGVTSFFAAIFSGVLANWFGFSFVFFAVGTLSLLSAFFIFFTPNLIVPPKITVAAKEEPVSEIRDHTPAGIGK
ncbi:MAG: MFS transporter [Candidatus Paceibacterota bacterium]